MYHKARNGAVHSLCDDGVFEALSADEAAERQVILVVADLVVFVVARAVRLVVHLALQLPAELVVGPVVHEDTRVCGRRRQAVRQAAARWCAEYTV